MSDRLTLERTETPPGLDGLRGILETASAAGTPVYPIGGGTALDFGLPVKAPGVGLSLAKLDRVIDYPARDMTITVEAGITMAALSRTLAKEGQELPLDVPLADRATLGGVIATNWSGPRRYGHGTIRDYVIGISAVDGVGRPFKGGGRVVKNVAGYDFCKLLVGSLGTLGVITQVTLKVKPRPQRSILAVCDVAEFELTERLLGALVTSRTTPAAIELLTGPDWLAEGSPGAAARLVVILEGTHIEVDWMAATLTEEWRALGVTECRVLIEADTENLWRRLIEWPALPDSPLVIKATVRPSEVTRFVVAAREIDPHASVQAHAGNGIVIVRFAQIAPGAVTKRLLGQLYPLATSCGGHVTALSSEPGVEFTPRAAFYGSDLPLEILQSVKRQFDPANILNRGRFVV
jgi:glycolate oxidase FAD binding subunit